MQPQFDHQTKLYCIRYKSFIFYGATPSSTIDTMNKCIALYNLDKTKLTDNNTINNK